jgi:glycosyltransferase involved in cell wall biosynthesis
MADSGGAGMKVLLIAPNVDGTDVGEALMAFKWTEALAARVELTVLCFQRPGRADVAGQLPGARVITWPEPAWALKRERLNAMLKPAWPVFAGHVRRWIATAEARGEHFDIAHQLMPQAARYPSPLRHFDTPYIIGPLGGALDTPEAFRAEAGSAPPFTRLRGLDATRFRFDPWLRASYSRAACILGVAPYVKDILGNVPLKRLESVLELGVDEVAPERPRQMETGRLDVLHVGRMVRTKGLRDVIRALALLPDLPGIRLTSAGAGEELELCRAEAEKLGVADRVRFPRPGAAGRGRGALRKPRPVLLPVLPRTCGRCPLRGDATWPAGHHCRPGRSRLDHRRQRGHQGAGHGPRHLRRRHRRRAAPDGAVPRAPRGARRGRAGQGAA